MREAEALRPRVEEGLEATFRKVRTRHLRRRMAAGIVGLALPALVFALGWFALRPSEEWVPAGPSTPSPSPTSSVAGGACGWAEGGAPVPDGYEPGPRALEGDVDADGTIDLVQVLTDEARPERCRFVLRVRTGSGAEPTAVIAPLEWPGTAPEPRLLAEIDGRPGVEVVVDLSPAGVYRPGAVFAVVGGALERLELQLQGALSAELFPLDDEFPAGVDCTGDAGTIVVTLGAFAEGGDTRWELTRTTYRADGSSFVRIGRETAVVDVGTEADRWPELAGEPFRSCPFVTGR